MILPTAFVPCQEPSVRDSSSSCNSAKESKTSSTTVSITLSIIKPKQLINIQLDENNSLQWKYQAEIAIRRYGFEGFINGSAIIPSDMTANKEGILVTDQEYIKFQRQYNLLSSWILSSISPNLVS